MKNPGERYKFKLFVAEGESNSVIAKENLARLCTKYLADCHETEVIDVLTDFEKALEYNIFITPTLIMLEPGPQVTLFGNLADTEKILVAMRVNSGNR